MSNLDLAQKQAQFDEFFSIQHSISVNLVCLSDAFEFPPVDELTENMPYAFRIASEMSEIESRALRPLRRLGEHAAELVEFLNHQSRKIDLIMSFILQQQDHEDNRYKTISFGGGGLTIVSDKPLSIGQKAELKLFLTDEASAVFTYAEVIDCKEADDQYHIALLFTRIREQDQDLIVRASLHLQTLQLRARAKQQKNEAE
ncbi:PilZ domain-containing protein [Aestuariibacter sp. AA17]|uniref:PilZ domain-containing protein n=1 Tax=Fluctibacter corallii TaxID=2984329 RepID=A0ABT3A938_9ALTE|nr:PilZ domain-containing protein [Aestuariibacter sp. AA17]MCV2885195.1 PilZ domain-containing protein [Aestuariibacter sp. AA17]